MNHLAERLALLTQRLRTAYDGIGSSHGRPYVYLVYPPDQERALRRLADDALQSDASLTFYHLDVLDIVLQSTAGQEERREALLHDPTTGSQAAGSLLRLWARRIGDAMHRVVQATPAERPVVVLRGLAALHPLGTPTGMMESLAEQEPRDPATGRVVPIVLFVPGSRPPQTSREYLFLGQERLRQDFYRGEEL